MWLFCFVSKLHDFPDRSFSGVFDADAFGGEFFADRVGGGKVFGFLGGFALGDLFFDVGFEVFVDRGFFLIAKLCEVEGENLVVVFRDRKLGCVVKLLVLQHVVQQRDAAGRVEVVADGVDKLLMVGGKLIGVDFALLFQVRDALQELLVRVLDIVEDIVAELQRLAVMGKQAEHAVDKRIVALALQHGDRQDVAGGFRHL